METVFKLEGLGCKSGNKYILKDIDWEVQKGQYCGRLYGSYTR